jgi:hypothetical protein
MSTATPNPPVTPVRPTATATQNSATDVHKKLKESSSQVNINESRILSEALAIREAPDKIEVPSTQPTPVIKDPPATQSQVPDQEHHDIEPVALSNESAGSPHDLESFDWDDFQARYDQAMAEAKTTEENLLYEFHELANASRMKHLLNRLLLILHPVLRHLGSGCVRV